MNSFDRVVGALRKQGLNSDQILYTLSNLFNDVTRLTDDCQIGKTYEQQIEHALKKAGMPTYVKGYKYWVEAIKLYKEKDGDIHLKDIYKQVAGVFGVSENRIQTAMTIAMEEAKPMLRASGDFPKRISNLTFLSGMSEKIVK